MELATYWLSHYGYFGLFFLLMLGIVGLPVPDETLLTFAGYLVYKGNLDLSRTMLAAFFGSVSGITISYGIGRSFGLIVIHKYGRFFHITPERSARVHNWFERIGRWALVAGYFIPGVRHVTAVLAGTSEMSALHFGLYAYAGALMWTSTFILLGFLLGERWSAVLHELERHLALSAWAGATIIVIYLLVRYRKRLARKQ